MIACAALVALGGMACSRSSEPVVTVAAASSLRRAMPDLVAAYRAQGGVPEIAVTYGASGSLRMQVEGGAPIDGVVFASAMPVDALIEERLIARDSRRIVASNELVLIGASGAAPTTFAELDALPDGARLAIGEPGAVPAGRYAKEWLQVLGHWQSLQDNLVFGGDVAAVLAYARRGEVDAAVVYSTEIQGVTGVQVFDVAGDAGAPIPQVVAGVTTRGQGRGNGRGPGVGKTTMLEFIDFLGSSAGQEIFASHGFRRAGVE